MKWFLYPVTLSGVKTRDVARNSEYVMIHCDSKLHEKMKIGPKSSLKCKQKLEKFFNNHITSKRRSAPHV
jgi:hypothetical protein